MELNDIQNLQGEWKTGWALGLATSESELPGTPHAHENCGKILNGKLTCCCSKEKWITHYDRIGALMHLCKYHQERQYCENIACVVVDFLKTKSKGQTPNLSAIIPVPPSGITTRIFQPVDEIVKIVGEKLNLTVDYDYLLKKRPNPQLKSIKDPVERKKILVGAFGVKDQRYNGKKVLLFDDLYDTGATLNEITKTLKDLGHVNNVYVLTITKTRSKK